MLIPLSAVANAGGMRSDETYTGNNYYVGIQADYSWQQVKGSSQQLQFNGNNLILTGEAPFKTNQEVFSGQLFIGHNIIQGGFTLDTELGVSFYDDSAKKIYINNVTGDLTVSSFVGEVSPRYNVTLSLLPGVQVNSMTFYGRLGAGVTKFKTTETSVIDNRVSPEVFSVAHTQEAWTPELTLGLGVKKDFDNNFSIRAEYNYKQTQSFDQKSNDARSSTNVNVVRVSNNSYKTTSNNVGIGFLYNFDA